MNKFNQFEKRTITPITPKIAVKEQIVMSKAELEAIKVAAYKQGYIDAKLEDEVTV